MTDDVHALSGLYVLDALDAADRLRFEAHLRRCPSCTQEVAELRATSARLGTVASEPPPPDLKAKVMAQVAVTRQEPPVVRRPAQVRTWLPRVAAGAVAAVLALTVGLLGWRLTVADGDLNRAKAMNQVLTAPDADTLRLVGADGVTARVVGSSSLGQTVVVLDGLTPVADDRAYALWLIGADGPEPVALVRPDGQNRAVAVLDRGLDGYQAFGMTEEPSTGSPQPTGPLLVQGPLT